MLAVKGDLLTALDEYEMLLECEDISPRYFHRHRKEFCTLVELLRKEHYHLPDSIIHLYYRMKSMDD